MSLAIASDLETAGAALDRIARSVPTMSQRELNLVAAVGSRLGAAAEKITAAAHRRAKDVPVPAPTAQRLAVEAVARGSAPTAAAAPPSAAAVGGTTDSGAPSADLASPLVTALGAVDYDDAQRILFDTEER